MKNNLGWMKYETPVYEPSMHGLVITGQRTVIELVDYDADKHEIWHIGWDIPTNIATEDIKVLAFELVYPPKDWNSQ